MNSTHSNPRDEAGNKRRLHPLVATAAAAVIVASLAATAAITGVFPKASSTGAQTDQTQAAAIAAAPAPAVAAGAQAPAPVTAPQSGTTSASNAPSAPPPQYAQTQAPQPAPPQPAQYAQQAQQPRAAEPSRCPTTCGTVEAISAVRHEGHGTGIGAVGGAVAGGVIGNQFGHGGGRTAMTLLGALGGGLGGNAIEKHMRSTTTYSVRVRMENGKTRYFTYRDVPPFQRGERVHLEHGALAAG